MDNSSFGPFAAPAARSSFRMAGSSDVVVLGLGVVLAALYLFKDSIFTASKSKTVPVAPTKGVANGGGNPRDFIAKMKDSVSPLLAPAAYQTGAFFFHACANFPFSLRKNASSFFTVLKLVQPRSMPSR